MPGGGRVISPADQGLAMGRASSTAFARARPAPLAFPLVAPHILQEEAIRLWRATDRTVKRWAAEHGVAFKKNDGAYREPTPRPMGFTRETTDGVSAKDLSERFNAGLKLIRRWRKEIGATVRSSPKPRPEPRPVSILHPQRASVRKDTAKLTAPRTALPSEPCFRCGARGWCGHDHRVAA